MTTDTAHTLDETGRLLVTSHVGRDFAVRIVREGDRYGATGSLVHDDARPLVEFYDLTYPDKFEARGQFVTRYYADTLLDSTPGTTGLDLSGVVAEWQLDAATYAVVLDWLRATLRPADADQTADAPVVAVAVIEYGMDFDQDGPSVIVAASQDVARARAADVIAAFADSDPDGQDGASITFGEFLAEYGQPGTDPEAVEAWLDAWQEHFTCAWVTVTTTPIHPA